MAPAEPGRTCPVAHDYPFTAPAPLDPPAEWAELRETCPVADIRLPSGDSALLASRYEDVKTLLADPRWTRQLDPAQGAARVSAQEDGGVFGMREGNALLQWQDHARWRRLLSRSFTAKRVNAMRPQIEKFANELVDGMEAGDRPADLASAFSFPLPVRVICELLGAPHEDRERFAGWSDAMLSMTRLTQEETAEALADFTGYMRAHIERKRAEPGDDLLSELTTISDSDDGRLSSEELLQTAMGLLISGYETTANMISKMVALLLTHDGGAAWDALLADRGRIPAAVEETLRMDANSGFGLPRFVSEDTEVAGGAIPAGSTVVNNLAAANRDASVFPDPDRLDLDRTPNRHITFGVGAHSCVGQALARAELQISLDVLTDRMPHLRLAVPPERLERRTGLVVGGLVGLPVTW
ncbi:cytochrome P450 [Nocardiopsis gilva YIM 90087]|uniref:Cytochrome P450 n=2 Tax=Nocardiopsis gilva TaxID=280236 RepID=A0A223SE78_9ACTN|nr:cytochrome P450 [Nocardiopsis gilva]ASU86451.1 cytochrome P450 [Nocardiopsis gilva YIM 90087]